MAVRPEASKSNWVPVVVAIVLLGVAGTVLAVHYYQPGPKLPAGAYFFDLTNDKLFVAKPAVPPIVGPSGDQGEGSGTAVRAYVFSCGSCDNQAERFVGYLETRSSERQKRAAAPGARGAPGAAGGSAAGAGAGAGRRFTPRDTGLEVASPADKETWVSEGSPEGRTIVGWPMSKCGEGQPAKVCEP